MQVCLSWRAGARYITIHASMPLRDSTPVVCGEDAGLL